MLTLQILLSKSNEEKYDFYIFKHKIAYIFLQICDTVVKTVNNSNLKSIAWFSKNWILH